MAWNETVIQKSSSEDEINNEVEKPPRDPAPLFTSPQTIVSVIIGTSPDQVSFPVYKETVCYHSLYLNASFQHAHTIILWDTDVFPDIFGMILHWMYTQTLPLLPVPDYTHLVALSKTYNLARRLGVPALQNYAVGLIHKILYNDEVRDEDKPRLKAFIHHVYETSGWQESEGEELKELKEDAKTKILAVHKFAFGIPRGELKMAIDHGHLTPVMAGHVALELKEGVNGRDLSRVEYYFVSDVRQV